MEEVYKIAEKYKDRCVMDKIICKSTRSKDIEVDREVQESPISIT